MTYFKGKCREGHVENLEYNFSTKDGKSLVQANNWGLVVKKGTVLVMSMIVEKLAVDKGKARAQRNICPHLTKWTSVMADEGWLQW